MYTKSADFDSFATGVGDFRCIYLEALSLTHPYLGTRGVSHILSQRPKANTCPFSSCLLSQPSNLHGDAILRTSIMRVWHSDRTIAIVSRKRLSYCFCIPFLTTNLGLFCDLFWGHNIAPAPEAI